jgi:hypothetical protein
MQAGLSPFTRYLKALPIALLLGCAGAPPARSPAPSAPTTVRPSTPVDERLPLEVDRRNGNCHIRLTGTLTDDTAHDLRYVMSALEKTNCNSKRVRLNLQNGLQSGSVGSAITVGAIIKNRGYDTQLQAGTTCLTPCMLVFAAGRQRLMLPSSPPTRIGFSQIPPDADFGRGVCETELLAPQAQTLIRYLRAMLPVTTANTVFQKLGSANCRSTEYLGQPEAETLGLATGGTGFPPARE